jgi:5-methylcytosine-specific restriction enzyme subunit McrC
MLYASGMLKELDPAKRNVEESPEDIPFLVVEILARRVERRLRRSLSVSYVEERADLSRVRGRIDSLESERKRLLQKGKVACRYQKLNENTLANRFVLAALKMSVKLVQAKDQMLAHRCRTLAGAFERMGVSGDCPTRAAMSAYRSTCSDRGDQQMLTAAKLVFDLLLPTEMAGNNSISSLERGTYIRKLFEKAVAGFYDVRLGPTGWVVTTGKNRFWPVQSESIGMASILPKMVTDIELESPSGDHRIIIDTKFAAITNPGQFGGETLTTGYVYQIYAYLRSQEGKDPRSLHASGLMLHPTVGKGVDEWVEIQGHMIRFSTVDLTASAVQIQAELLARIGHPMTVVG